ILHAPGYPSYVLAARLFSSLVPFGSWAFRVNLFSLLCASVTVGFVYSIARRVGAGVAGSLIGALALATTTSFWFYAGVAKHYPFSALPVTSASYLMLTWQDRGAAWRPVAAGAILGVCAGASWQLALITIVGLVVLVALGDRKPSVAVSIAAGGAVIA